MIKLYHGPRTRSIRIYWLLEELGLPFQLQTVEYRPPQTPFSQQTPLGKFPVLDDGEVVMFESGAILEYLLDRYAPGRLAPLPGTPERAMFLQWVHFAEATLMPPILDIARHTMLKPEPERIPAVAADGRVRTLATLGIVERALEGRRYLPGPEFSGADIMLGYPLYLASMFGLLDGALPNVGAYWKRLVERPALRKTAGLG
jgi:glutathione S-transferase